MPESGRYGSSPASIPARRWPSGSSRACSSGCSIAADPVARALLARAVVHVVPNMNPDGSVRGNLRTNAAGANLNREWMAPTRGAQPRSATRARGDARDRRRRLSRRPRRRGAAVRVRRRLRAAAELHRRSRTRCSARFGAAFERASPDFQTVHGYPTNKETKVNLTLASKYVGHTFGCLALTLEMPFKDNADLPDAEVGWNGERSRRLGVAALQPLLRRGASTCRLAIRRYALAPRENAMQTIVVANPKGGSGKTTLATNVAGWLAARRQRVVLADFDPLRVADRMALAATAAVSRDRRLDRATARKHELKGERAAVARHRHAGRASRRKPARRDASRRCPARAGVAERLRHGAQRSASSNRSPNTRR